MLRFLPLLALLLAGCGGNNSTLRGKVSHNGKPVTSGMVVVLNPDRTTAKGEIEPDGSYSVSGVGRGQVQVGVLSPDPAHHAARPAHSRKPKPKPTEGWVPLPDEAGNPSTSGIVFEMTGSATHDIVVP